MLAKHLPGFQRFQELRRKYMLSPSFVKSHLSARLAAVVGSWPPTVSLDETMRKWRGVGCTALHAHTWQARAQGAVDDGGHRAAAGLWAAVRDRHGPM